MTGWKTLALNTVELLEDRVDGLDVGKEQREHFKSELQHIRCEHELARKASVGERLSGLWRDDNRSHTWDEIHRLAARIEEREPTEGVLDDARRHAKLGLGEARLEEFEEALKDKTGERDQKRLALGVIRDANAASAVRYEAQRQQQRGIVSLAVLLLLGAVTTAVLQWRVFPTSALVPPPRDASALSSWAVLGLVMFFGMVGGGFSALMALYVTNKTYTDTYWFDPRPGLTLMKVSVGVWSAVFGMLGVSSGLVVGTYKNFAALVVLAFLFGYGQQVITGLIDKRVESLAAGTISTVPPGS